MKNMIKGALTTFAAVATLTVLTAPSAQAEGVCEGANRQNVCLKMRHLRASINVLDAQRELMQINPNFYTAMGLSLSSAAAKARMDYGYGIPEHITGLSRVEQMSIDMANQALTGDLNMVKTANVIRFQCATCHAQNSGTAGNVDWDNIFKYDWEEIAKHCNGEQHNPYLCRSMNGMLSAYGYLLTAYDADLTNFAMTREAADEIVRILTDIKVKGFDHLPEDLRLIAENEAREVSQMARDQNPDVFERASKITNACQQCHARASGSRPAPLNLSKFKFVL